MASTALAKIRSELMLLSEPERAELAYELLKSLDAPADEALDEAWGKEIVRRINQIDSGQAKLLSRKELRKKIQDRIGN